MPSLPVIPSDKAWHYLVGQYLSLAILTGGLILASHYLITLHQALYISIAVTVIVAALKELYDHFHPLTHSCELEDFLFTVLGAFPLWTFYYILLPK